MGNTPHTKWHVCKPSQVEEEGGIQRVKKWKCTRKAFLFNEAVKLGSDQSFFNPLGIYDYRLVGSSGPLGIFTPLPWRDFELEDPPSGEKN